MRNTNEQSMKEVLEALLKAYRIESGVNTAMIEASWVKMMGITIAKHTKEIQLRDKTLFLKIDAPALRHELNFAKEKIKNNINEEFKMNLVEEVVIR
jgi:predicted nucleic acid-binding Zn ribbon protein